jgi:hypothetical protein
VKAMMFDLSPDQIQKIKVAIQHADSLIISAGAGMGVDSGLPDFRGNHGMWQAYPELGKQRIDFTEIANPAAFRLHPRLAWGFYGHRLALYRQTKPHRGFTLLKQLAETLQLPYFIFTSNVDGQFQKAGFDSANIYECHGSIHHLQCLKSCQPEIWSADDISPAVVAGGISQALLTTAFGLIVAMIIQIFQNVFVSRIDKLVLDMEEHSVQLVDHLYEMESNKK